MSKISGFRRRLAHAAAMILLVACATSGARGAQMQNSGVVRVALSDMTLEFAYPTLKVSKDFGPVRLFDDIDLSKVEDSNTILFGHWDGPRYKLLSVTGTLKIWLDVLPWPEQARAAKGCEAKTKAFLEAEVESQLAFYRRAETASPPTIDRFKVSIRGRDGMGFRDSYSNDVSYFFPVNRDLALRLVFTSINNSRMGSDWDALSGREQDRFLRTMALSGDSNDCM
jgi:hypothetical protein